MGSIKRIFFLILLSFCCFGCSLLEKGYTNEHKQYVPKKPNFKLKDKKGGILAPIDTLAGYKMVEMYNNGELIYPLDLKDALNDYRKELNNNNKYIKFYKNGRCLIFSIPIKDALGGVNSLKIEDLNPNNNFYNKDYYYNANGKNIQIEGFAYGAGQGHYVISNYTINNVGDILIDENGAFKIVYKKETLPANWSTQYKIDW